MESGANPRRRREDQSAWAWFNEWVTRFAGLIAALGVIGTAVAAISGLRVLTYADQINDLRLTQDTTNATLMVMRQDVTALRISLDSVKRISESLKLMRCMDGDVTQQQLGLVQIECPGWTVQGRAQQQSLKRGIYELPPRYPRSSHWWLGRSTSDLADASLWR